MSFYRDFKDFILSYDYDLDKNFVISFPKTGRTWLRHMIKEMIRKSTNKLDVTFTHDHSEIITEDDYLALKSGFKKRIKDFKDKQKKAKEKEQKNKKI